MLGGVVHDLVAAPSPVAVDKEVVWWPKDCTHPRSNASKNSAEVSRRITLAATYHVAASIMVRTGVVLSRICSHMVSERLPFRSGLVNFGRSWFQ